MNPHKWFLTNMECCCLWIRQPSSLTDSLSTHSEIMRNSASESNRVIDYKDWQIALSRRFRALKLWVVIRKHGLAKLMYHIHSDVNMAKRFEAMVSKDKRFEIVVPRKFALVCFRLKPKNESNGSELNSKLLDAVNSSGRAFITHAAVGGVYVIRCAVGSTLTEERHVDDLWKLIQEKAQIKYCKLLTS
ncbi:Tyrosine decarboxylase [Melia azedarach]|uniref:Tyrosine decarboxylase n=1 Tax=Melia azedarach TaxID=155640 RepID=A0ACC1YBU0_MELAZ|nr:Tyrosine decarboxylase [Melia azedarach]